MGDTGVSYDAIVIGSGPNGLAGAIRLAESGASVLVLEAKGTVGGGMRTTELTMPGFQNDICSAAHPMAVLSPYLQTLPLEEHGLEWSRGESSVAHPMDDGPAVLLKRSVAETVNQFPADAGTYERLIGPFLKEPHGFLSDALAPLQIPSHPILMARFGLRGLRSAVSLGRRFQTEQAKALFAGCAAHSVLPLTKPVTAALGLIFLITGHVDTWPVVKGGTQRLADAMASYLLKLGGEIETDCQVTSLEDLPSSKVVLFDTNPRQLIDIAGEALPSRYRARLAKYRYGPGTFKLDYALDGPIPWRDERCNSASTVHLGGTMEEINKAETDVWNGKHPDKPFVLLVQQSELDSTRAPEGKHTGYAYCHVPHGSDVDQTEAVERQIERFAPGFRDRIIKRHVMTPSWLEEHNPNYLGGAVTGGVADIKQLFTRPVARLNPYTTPNRRLFICSAATPPGGGVHGMCGYYAAEKALQRLRRMDGELLLPG
jgi:phytoene dehydrogenase-like protein